MTGSHSGNTRGSRGNRILSSIVFAALCCSSLPAQSQSKPPATRRVVADSVRRVGSKIVGGWREYANDGTWRRAVFALDVEAGNIIFGDGVPGQRIPGVTRYVWSGNGRRDSIVDFSEARSFATVTPATLLQARRSSAVPLDVAARIRSLGGDVRLLRRMVDVSGRMREIGSAFDAAQGARGAPGVAAGLPGSDTRGRTGKWVDPRGGLGGNGQASDGKLPSASTSPGGSDEVVSSDQRTGTDGTSESTVVTRHSDGSSTTQRTWSDGSGQGSSSSEKDKNGNVTGGASTIVRSDGEAVVTTYTRDVRSGEIRYQTTTVNREGARTVSGRRTTPPETGGRTGYEAEIAQFIPWLIEAQYIQWKRETDLVRSGGRVTQPGGQPSLVLNEGPEVGVSGVINCGDSNTSPCARTGGTVIDPRGGLGQISQPGRGVPTGPIPGKEAPRPLPRPNPKP